MKRCMIAVFLLFILVSPFIGCGDNGSTTPMGAAQRGGYLMEIPKGVAE